MRARGYRPIQMRVPDVRRLEFVDEANRQAEAVAATDAHSDDQEFVEAITATWDDE